MHKVTKLHGAHECCKVSWSGLISTGLVDVYHRAWEERVDKVTQQRPVEQLYTHTDAPNCH